MRGPTWAYNGKRKEANALSMPVTHTAQPHGRSEAASAGEALAHQESFSPFSPRTQRKHHHLWRPHQWWARSCCARHKIALFMDRSLIPSSFGWNWTWWSLSVDSQRGGVHMIWTGGVWLDSHLRPDANGKGVVLSHVVCWLDLPDVRRV